MWTREQADAFGKLLREARAARGLQQSAVSEGTGVGISSISRLENGAYEGMRWSDIVALARYYGLSLDAVAEVLGAPPAAEGSHASPLPGQVRLAFEALTPDQQEWVLSVVHTLLRGLQA